ncbi:hypothetical protein OPV22_017072 [Ensete ventricosum]|uniref:Uncharacterized protein n=1 Tax=Ensete ventricosum TaxID=4639 RepID=A0AAV8R046_ENSVE|nr:hypothetical protein OPV22_017072 [Ensete ventricosum]
MPTAVRRRPAIAPAAERKLESSVLSLLRSRNLGEAVSRDSLVVSALSKKKAFDDHGYWNCDSRWLRCFQLSSSHSLTQLLASNV